jgi:hypothetical protein
VFPGGVDDGVHLGGAQARTMLLHAAVAEPYDRIVWRELHAWAALNETRITQVFISRSGKRVANSRSISRESAFR